MDFACPVCGAALEDPGEAFIAHMRANPDCRAAYEHGSESTAEEWAKR